MSYTVIIQPSAEREFLKLPRSVLLRAQQKIWALESVPRPRGCRKLKDTDIYRYRIGTYRVLYSIDDKKQQVVILAIGHRREVYRKIQ